MQMVPAISKVGGDASHGSHRAVAPTGGGADGRAQIPDVPLAPSCSRALLYTPTPAAAPLDFLLRPRRSHAIRSTTRILFPCVVDVALATAARCTCRSRRRPMLALQRPRRDSFTTAKPRTRRWGRGRRRLVRRRPAPIRRRRRRPRAVPTDADRLRSAARPVLTSSVRDASFVYAGRVAGTVKQRPGVCLSFSAHASKLYQIFVAC